MSCRTNGGMPEGERRSGSRVDGVIDGVGSTFPNRPRFELCRHAVPAGPSIAVAPGGQTPASRVTCAPIGKAVATKVILRTYYQWRPFSTPGVGVVCVEGGVQRPSGGSQHA